MSCSRHNLTNTQFNEYFVDKYQNSFLHFPVNSSNYGLKSTNWIENYLDFCEFCTAQSGLDFVPKLPPLPSLSNHKIANSSLDTIECQLKIRKYLVSEGPFFLPKGFVHWLTQLHTPLGHYIHITKMCKKQKCIKLMVVYMVIGRCSLESKMWGNNSLNSWGRF